MLKESGRSAGGKGARASGAGRLGWELDCGEGRGGSTIDGPTGGLMSWCCSASCRQFFGGTKYYYFVQ